MTTSTPSSGEQATIVSTGEVIIYHRDDAPALEVKLSGETVWLSQQQIAELFQTSRTNVVEHIQHIYQEGELAEEATCRNFRQVRTEGSREVARELPFYNLDAIISVGYRVKSKIATQFRIWATNRLHDYLVKGYAIHEQRLEQPFSESVPSSQPISFSGVNVVMLSQVLLQRSIRALQVRSCTRL